MIVCLTNPTFVAARTQQTLQMSYQQSYSIATLTT